MRGPGSPYQALLSMEGKPFACRQQTKVVGSIPACNDVRISNSSVWKSVVDFLSPECPWPARRLQSGRRSSNLRGFTSDSQVRILHFNLWKLCSGFHSVVSPRDASEGDASTLF